MNKNISIHIDLIFLLENDLGNGLPGSRWFKFPCPFHKDRYGKSELTLIATNGDDKRGPYWCCLSCKERGDAIAWLMKYRKQAYWRALIFLEIGRNPIIRPRETRL